MIDPMNLNQTITYNGMRMLDHTTVNETNVNQTIAYDVVNQSIRYNGVPDGGQPVACGRPDHCTFTRPLLLHRRGTTGHRRVGLQTVASDTFAERIGFDKFCQLRLKSNDICSTLKLISLAALLIHADKSSP